MGGTAFENAVTDYSLWPSLGCKISQGQIFVGSLWVFPKFRPLLKHALWVRSDHLKYQFIILIKLTNSVNKEFHINRCFDGRVCKSVGFWENIEFAE